MESMEKRVQLIPSMIRVQVLYGFVKEFHLESFALLRCWLRYAELDMEDKRAFQREPRKSN